MGQGRGGTAARSELTLQPRVRPPAVRAAYTTAAAAATPNDSRSSSRAHTQRQKNSAGGQRED